MSSSLLVVNEECFLLLEEEQATDFVRVLIDPKTQVLLALVRNLFMLDREPILYEVLVLDLMEGSPCKATNEIG